MAIWGMLGKISKVKKPTKDPASGPVRLSTSSREEEGLEQKIAPCCRQDHSSAHELSRMTVVNRELKKHTAKKVEKGPTTLGQNSRRKKNM